jgi:hypothetical protein
LSKSRARAHNGSLFITLFRTLLVLQHHKIALRQKCLSAKQNPLKCNTCRAESRRRSATTSTRLKSDRHGYPFANSESGIKLVKAHLKKALGANNHEPLPH